MTFLLRFGSGAALATLAAAFCSSAQATTLTTAQLEAAICPHHPDAKTIMDLQGIDSDFQCSNFPAHSAAKPVVTAGRGSTAAGKSVTKAPPRPLPPNTEYTVKDYFLRNSWTDLGILGGGCYGPNAPQPGVPPDKATVGVPVDKAKGASASYTQDYVGNNRIWAAQGMAAAVFSDCRVIDFTAGGSDSGFFEKSIGIYAQVNATYNSNSQMARNNVDTRTAGLAGELAYANGLDINVVRVTPNVVVDQIHGTTAVAVMAQYVPIWLTVDALWHHYMLFGSIWFQFDPTLDLQYASSTSHTPLLFSGRDQSLRIGPELTFVVQPFASSHNLLSQIGINETFHPWYEAYSSRSSYWWANSIFYNITPDGNFAVAFSYNRGLDENSGAMTNQYVVSLTGKY